MATVYSLICFGGRTGKTVTFTDAGDVVNLTNNGLRAGSGVVFSTTSALPTGLTAGTTYYAKPGADANKFLLYPTSADAIAGTNQVTFSGTGSGTHTVNGAYFLGLTTEQLARYGSPGSERIYDGIAAARTARNTAATGFEEEVIEVGEAWSDYSTTTVFSMTNAPLTTITSLVDGVRSAAYHNGNPGEGYWWSHASSSAISVGNFIEIEGITIRPATAAQHGIMLSLDGLLSAARNCIFYGWSSSYSVGLQAYSSLMFAENNLILDLSVGLRNYGANQGVVCGNTVSKCAIGVESSNNATTNRFGHWRNNISVGNATNWAVEPTSLQSATNNFGVSGDTPWAIGSGTTGTMATTDFADFANNDFRPASSSSPQVDAGIEYYAMPATDIADDERPNYNNGGAEGIDAGCYEYDHGYGPHPASHTLTLTNVAVGSRVFIRDQANTTTHYDQIAASSTVEITVTIYGDARDNWRIKIRKASAAPYYQSYETLMTATAGNSSIYVNQLPN